MRKTVIISFFLITAGCTETYKMDPHWPEVKTVQDTSKRWMVSAAHPKAVAAGEGILRAGGNAVDAAVAVQMALNVVEPSESGIGGGAFLLFRNGQTGVLSLYDGRETAPASARPDRFVLFGHPLPLWAAVPTGLSTGVPGTPAMLEKVHRKYGKRPWHELFEPAIRLAEQGIPVTGRLRYQIENDPSLRLFRDTRRHFVRPLRVVHPDQSNPVMHNHELARTFRMIASGGSEEFYKGDIAGDIVEAVRSRRPGSGDLAKEDLHEYHPIKRDALCGTYRKWTVCGPPAPSSGGIAVLQILGILEHFRISSYEPGDPAALHLIAEASRLAFADRERFIGDPQFVKVPQDELIDSLYLSGRAALIDPGRTRDHILPGNPVGSAVRHQPGLEVTGRHQRGLQTTGRHRPGLQTTGRHLPETKDTGRPVSGPALSDSDLPVSGSGLLETARSVHYERETSGTTHFSIVDAEGNAVSMTSSIEAPFGSRIMTNGFLLNNQLTDFTFQAEQDGFRSPNVVEAGKRPRSSMAPTMVFDENGELVLVIGSRGGSRIIGYVVKTLVGMLDWDLSLHQAIAMPNVVHRGERLELESGTVWAERAAALEKMGHDVRVRPLESGVHGIARISEKRVDHDHAPGTGYYWVGAADPRMDGVAKGE